MKEPKLCGLADLHLHLDGAISLSSARELAKLGGVSIPDSDEEILKLMQVSPGCKDLNEFLEKFEFPCSLLQTKECITRAVQNLLCELNEEGIIYAEIRFAPQKSTDQGLTQEDAILAALEGTKHAPIPCGLILCCMRGKDNRKENLETVTLAEKYLGDGVVAVDLAGAEALFPTEDFAEIFDVAREKGIPFTIHAGEASGSDSVRNALSFEPKRIGHGVRSVEDPRVIAFLASNGIPLELCPSSNLSTQVYESLSDFPLKQLLDAGVLCTINTDDPSIIGTTLKKEYELLIREFGLNQDTVQQLKENAILASFAPDSVKEELLCYNRKK
ncbi:MAG: adenosine deaminase [Lachnospiraceae bacterium]|nr:adenosine deaminase [Lachnospiraceae bacterium]